MVTGRSLDNQWKGSYSVSEKGLQQVNGKAVFDRPSRPNAIVDPMIKSCYGIYIKQSTILALLSVGALSGTH
jgi:hypothetical protein